MQGFYGYVLRFAAALSLCSTVSYAGLLMRSLPARPSDKLIFLQAAWRHGDRTPTRTFKSDINQIDQWPQGWGQLTVKGMEQHVTLGKKLRKRYVDETKFMSGAYKNSEIYVRSTDLNRTLTSAISNMIGFYGPGARQGVDYPNIPDWPVGYIPVAIHTADFYNDHIGNTEPLCPRQESIMNLWKYTPEYKAFMKEKQPLFDKLTQLCGQEVTPLNIQQIYDVLYIEKLWNKTRNDWVTEELVKEIEDTTYEIEAWTNGRKMQPYEGFNFSVELPKLRGGGILWSLIDNMRAKVDCMKKHGQDANVTEDMSHQCKWITPLKYYAYSVHDTTLAALFTTWGLNKTNWDKDGYPHYSACITVELWERPDQTNYIQVGYWYPEPDKNNEPKIEDMTNDVVGCENGCSLEEFASRSLLYKAEPSPESYCQNVDLFDVESVAPMVAILPQQLFMGAISSLIGLQLSYFLA